MTNLNLARVLESVITHGKGFNKFDSSSHLIEWIDTEFSLTTAQTLDITEEEVQSYQNNYKKYLQSFISESDEFIDRIDKSQKELYELSLRSIHDTNLIKDDDKLIDILRDCRKYKDGLSNYTGGFDRYIEYSLNLMSQNPHSFAFADTFSSRLENLRYRKEKKV